MKQVITILVVAVIIMAVGFLLLNLGARGALPTGFGLLDMSKDTNRAIVFVVLVVLVAVLGGAYSSVRKRSR